MVETNVKKNEIWTCPHVATLLGQQSLKNIDVAAKFILLHRYRLVRSQLKEVLNLECAACGETPVPLYLCVDCSFVGCWGSGHIQDHCASHQHNFGICCDTGDLFCFACGDHAYCQDVIQICSEIETKLLDSFPIDSRRYDRLFRGFSAIKHESPDTSEKDISAAHASLIRSHATRVDGSSHPGMWNLGNTCFMSSVLQVLLHIPLLRNFFLSDKHTEATCDYVPAGDEDQNNPMDNICLGCELDVLFSRFYHTDPSPIAPDRFLIALWMRVSNLMGYEQQDAHECLIGILNALHEVVTATAENDFNAPNNGHGHSADACGCIAHQAFAGVLRSDTTCLECFRTSTVFEPFFDVSLSIVKALHRGGTPTLTGCLRHFTCLESFEGSEALSCTRCRTRTKTAKQLSLCRLPPVLVFHLKRFHHTHDYSTGGSGAQTQKIETFVDFPLTSLDMSVFISDAHTRAEPSGGRRQRATGRAAGAGGGRAGADGEPAAGARSGEAYLGSQLYDLMGVVTHIGTMDSGHYIAFVRDGRKWYKCDDANVTEVRADLVQAESAYLLIYIKRVLEYSDSET